MRQHVSKGAQAKNRLPTEVRLLNPAGVAYVASHRLLFVAVPWLWFRLLDLYFLSPNQDVSRYFNSAGQWLAGMTPYKNFLLEYPPGSLFSFVLPRLFTDDFNTYSWLFAAEMVCVDIAMMLLVVRVAGLVQRSVGDEAQSEAVQRYDTTVAVMGYVAFSGALGYLAFERYDLTFTFLVLAWVECALAKRQRWLADGMLALGIWCKLLSVMFIPIYLAFLCAQDVGPLTPTWRASSQKMSAWLWRQGTRRMACIVGMTVALFAPFYLMAPDEIFNFLKYHHDRGVQLESTAASFFLLWHHLTGEPLRAQHVYGAMEVVHPLVQGVVRVCSYFTFVALGAASLWFGRRLLRAENSRARAHLLIEGACVHLLAFIGCNKVFSPQYLLWFAPLAGLTILRDPSKTRRWLLGFATLYGITGLILFFYYHNLIWFEIFPTALLLTRNFFVFAMAWTVSEVSFGSAIINPWQRLMGRLGQMSGSRVWSPLALFMCALWVFCANLSETTANDIWIQLKSGADIVASHAMPYVETYSATVSGRPFIAHEWLSGVLFYGLDWAFGDAGLSFLAAFVALGTFTLMYFAFDRPERKTLWYLPLLLFLSYLVAFRVLVRPHIFTILAQAALMMAVERWRRRGGIAQLWWLVPMQLLWINLHGAALFGPAFITMVAGCVGLMVLVPQLQTFGAEQRLFTQRDVYTLIGVAVAMAVACIVNPYGTRIVAFSIDLFGNSYAKSRVWEWTTPFLPTNVSYYWLWLYISGLILLWASVIARLRFVPIIDLAYAVLVTYLSTRANRFVPDFAIFSFPVVVRAMTHLARTGLRPVGHVQRPWVELSLATLLFTNCVVYGYAHSAREHRPLIGWGYGGDMPYQEVGLIKRLGLKGIIFNEYSDGALIIHELVPQVRPVLDSRIDLYPLDQVEEYDRAYVVPQLFERYVERHNVNIIMLYAARAAPRVVQYIENSPQWRRLSSTNGRLLYVKRTDALASGAQ